MAAFRRAFEILLDEFLDHVDEVSGEGWTALHLAAMMGALPAVELLVQYQANPRIARPFPGLAIIGTAYDMALVALLRVSLDRQSMGIESEGPFRAEYSMNDIRPQEAQVTRLAINKISDLFKILELLSDADGVPISSHAEYDHGRKEIVADMDPLKLKLRHTSQLATKELEALENRRLSRMPGSPICLILRLGGWILDVGMGNVDASEFDENGKPHEADNDTFVDLDKF